MQQIIADVFLCWMLVLAANAVLNVISDVRADNRDRREREESGVFCDAQPGNLNGYSAPPGPPGAEKDPWWGIWAAWGFLGAIFFLVSL